MGIGNSGGFLVRGLGSPARSALGVKMVRPWASLTLRVLFSVKSSVPLWLCGKRSCDLNGRGTLVLARRMVKQEHRKRFCGDCAGGGPYSLDWTATPLHG